MALEQQHLEVVAGAAQDRHRDGAQAEAAALDLGVELPGKVVDEGLPDRAQRRRPAELAGHRGDAALAQPARDDLAEEVEAVGDVEREAVRGDPAAHLDADRADLAQAPPRLAEEDAGRALDAVRADREVGQRGEHDLFEVVDVAPHVAAVGREAEDRVGDELARHVAGHVAAARHVEHLDAALLKTLTTHQQILTVTRCMMKPSPPTRPAPSFF